MADFIKTNIKNKIFMAGIMGSGKTFTSKKIAEDNKLGYIDLDLLFDYDSKYNQSAKIIEKLPQEFVIDGIPNSEQINGRRNWNDFSKYEEENDVTVICVYCPDKKEWIKRMNNRIKAEESRFKRLAKYYAYRFKRLPVRLRVLFGNMENFNDFKEKINIIFNYAFKPYFRYKMFTDLNDLYNKLSYGFIDYNLPRLNMFKEVIYYDTCSNEITTREEMVLKIKKSIGDS